jgi:hypothetical protein
MHRTLIALVAAAMISTLSSTADGQRRRNSFGPGYGFGRTPTISPYVDLFRGNVGGLNSYLSVVRPQQRQIMFDQNQMAENRQFEQQLMQNQMMMQQSMGMPQPMGAGGVMLRPGTQTLRAPMPAASYFNYSHYYGVPVSNGGQGAGGLGQRFR